MGRRNITTQRVRREAEKKAAQSSGLRYFVEKQEEK